MSLDGRWMREANFSMTTDLSALAPLHDAGVSNRLFCVEAADRAGKTTLCDNLTTYLADRHGFEVRIFREPGGSPRAEQIRKVLKSEAGMALPVDEQVRLFYEAREDLLRTTLLPWLAASNNRVAILDRYFWSTIVYQGFFRGADLGKLAEITARVCDGAMPRRTYFLDIAPEVAHARVTALGADADVDPNDLLAIEGKRQLRDGYTALLNEFPEFIMRIDADQTPYELTRQVGDNLAFLARSAT